MKPIKITEVRSREDYFRFAKFPFSLYRNNPYWTPPIIREEVETFDRKLNPVFEHSEARLFLAWRGGKVVGRVAAIISGLEVEVQKKDRIRFGWLDMIDDVAVTEALLREVVGYGRAMGLKTIEGPMGFSNLDKAGMLTMGFEEPNTMITWYNAPYYQKHMEALGYKKAAQWVEFEIIIASYEDSPQKVKEYASLVKERYGLQVLDLKTRGELLPYVDQIFDLLRDTYQSLQTFVPIHQKQVDYYKRKYFNYIHPGYIKCVANAEGKLVAFVITMPSFTKALKKAKGRLFPFGFLHILWAQWFNARASFYLIGVHPDFQNKGVTSILFLEMQKFFNKKGITIAETNPELEENTAVQKLWKNYEHRHHKKRATFSKRL